MSKLLGFALFAGQVVWSGHLLLSYLLADLACSTATDETLLGRHLVTIAALALTTAATVVVSIEHRRRPRQATPRSEVASTPSSARQTATEYPAPERRFVVYVALIGNGIFLLAIVLAGATSFFLAPCT
jgi:hypothetical protein